MIEFKLGMPAEEYIRKHRSLINMVADAMEIRRIKPLDIRRIPNEQFYLFYMQIPASKNTIVHAFLTSNRKSLHIPGWDDVAFVDSELKKSLTDRISTKLFVAVSFDTPVGKYIYHSSAHKSSDSAHSLDDVHYNILLSPRFLESYQALSPKCPSLNILHRFIINETMGYNKQVAGSTINCDSSDDNYREYNCNKTYMRFNSGISYGNLIGTFPDSGDPSNCIFQLNSYYPESVNSRKRIEMTRFD